jgi:hypothetical protein
VTYEAVDTADGITLAETVTVTFSAPADPRHAFISVSPTTIPADKTTTATVTVTLETNSGAPAVGTFTITGYVAGTATFRAKDVTDSWTEAKTANLVETPSVQLTVG